MAAAVNRPLPHYRLGDLGIVPRSHPKLGERPRATSPLAPINKQTRSIGVQTVSAQKVSGAPSFLGSYPGHTCVSGPSAVMVQKTKGRRPLVDGLVWISEKGGFRFSQTRQYVRSQFFSVSDTGSLRGNRRRNLNSVMSAKQRRYPCSGPAANSTKTGERLEFPFILIGRSTMVFFNRPIIART